MKDLIERQAAIDAVLGACKDTATTECAVRELEELPPAQPTQTNTPNALKALDCVERQAAIDANGLDEEIRCEMCKNPMHTDRGCDGNCKYDEILYEKIIQILNKRITPLPSAQPERTCVNCGRTANNGGWYADGRTRCPIEEHYALPKDGFCHLWEKRNVTDDDYPERREE